MHDPIYDISIVTPSYNMLDYLKMNMASVKDQAGVRVEHIVIDGNSTDGSREWLASLDGIRYKSEKDNGMYDALNKGLDMVSADIIGHLNCDEQYLPGTLESVMKIFRENPDIDFIVGDFLVVNGSGDLLAYRKSFQPKWRYFFSNYLYTFTCTTFYRKRVIDNCRYDDSYRSIADMIFLYNVLKKGYKGKHIRQYFSIFTDTGRNLSLNNISDKERKRFLKTLPLGYRLLMPVFRFTFYIDRWLNGAFSKDEEICYSIYQKGSKTRMLKRIENPPFRWAFSN